MGLKSMTLLGHSLGAYIAGSYTFLHPEVVSRLVLLSPFGMVPDTPLSDSSKLPFLLRAGVKLFGRVSPHGLVRGLGPIGPAILRTFRHDDDRFGFHNNLASDYIFQVRSPMLAPVRWLLL